MVVEVGRVRRRARPAHTTSRLSRKPLLLLLAHRERAPWNSSHVSFLIQVRTSVTESRQPLVETIAAREVAGESEWHGKVICRRRRCNRFFFFASSHSFIPPRAPRNAPFASSICIELKSDFNSSN